MQESQASSPGREAGPSPESIRPAGLFSDLKYAAPAPTLRPAPPVTVARRKKVFTRIILPLLIFVIGIAAVAWVVQFMPRSGKPTPVPGQGLRLEFTNPNHIWGTLVADRGVVWGAAIPEGVKKEQLLGEYIAEYETDTTGQKDAGFCDFEFKNATGQQLQVVLGDKFCQCSNVELALPTEAELARYRAHRKQVQVPHGTRFGDADRFTWTEMKRDQDGEIVEPGQTGIVRVLWNGRDTEKPKNLLVWADLLVGPKGAPLERVKQRLQVKITYVEPVRFLPAELQTVRFTSGSSGSNEQTLLCWSSTRDLSAAATDDDPLVQAIPEQLRPEECLTLEKRLAREYGIITHVRSACRVQVTIREQKDGRQLDLGSVQKPLPVTFRGDGEGLKSVAPPPVRVEVRGDVKVNGLGDRLQVNLNDIAPGTRSEVEVKVWTRADDLEPVAQLEPPRAGLTAKLAKAGTEAGGTVWNLTITIGSDVRSGLVENTAVVLRRKNSSQSIRLPVTGHVSARR